MQKAAVRRLLTGCDLVGSVVLVGVPLLGKVGPYIILPGAVGLILAVASLYWSSGEIYAMCVGVCSFMLFAAFSGWAVAFWGIYSNLGDEMAMGLLLICTLIGLGFLLATLVVQRFSKDQK